MQCKVVKPNVTTYKMRFNKDEDPDMYYRCMWARITLDHDNFTLSAVSDCGDYTYSWQVTESETFIDLMKRINDDYLLNKISDRTVFKLDESKKETIDYIKTYYISDDIHNYHEKLEEINEIEDCSEEYFFRTEEDIFGDELDFEVVSIVKDYPEGAKVFCRIFREYLQPLLKENIHE